VQIEAYNRENATLGLLEGKKRGKEPAQHKVADRFHSTDVSNNWRIKNQLEATYYFIVLLIGSTCFRHYYAHHQELATIL